MKPCPPTALSHRELLRRVAPFLQAGWQVDLSASDRHAGRIRLCPPSAGPESGGHLELWLHGAQRLALRRAVQRGALTAELTLHAQEPAPLLAALAAWPSSAQWREGPGWHAALSHEGEARAPRLHKATVHVRGLQLRLIVPLEGARSAQVELSRLQGRTALPEDLLSVLGWHWSPLVAVDGGWAGSVRLPRDAAARGVERRLLEVAHHLARTLGEAPLAFHRHQRAARWRVLLRRTVPLALWALLPVLAAAAPGLAAARHTPWPLLVLAVPLAMAAYLHASQGGRTFEWPALPRPLHRASW